MLGSSISLQSPPLESLISIHRSPINADRGDRKENIVQMQSHISSLYEPDPFPGIDFHHDPANRWESIAKEILTPFAPKHPIYNYKKFIPARYQKLISPILSPTSSLFENKNHTTKPLFSRKVSFAENTIQMLFNNDKETDDKELDQKLYNKFMSGSQTTRYENLRPIETEDTKKSSTLKKFLIKRESSHNILDMRQIQSRGKIRPQTAAESSGKDKARTLFIEANGNTVGNFSDEASRNDKDTSDSTVEGENKKDNSGQGKLIPHPKVLAAMKAAKEAGKLTTQGSRRSLLVTDKPFITRSSFQKEDKSREGSVRSDSKFSIMFRKVAEEEVNKANKVTQLQSNIRRKSDTSKYSGGECLKLTKHMDIILPSDNIKRFKQKTPSPPNLLIKENSIINLLKTKKRSEYDKKKDIRTSQASPRNTPNIPFLETINSAQALKPNDLEVKSPGMEHSAGRKPLELNQRTRSVNQARVSHLRAITPLASNTKMIFGLDEFSSIKSKTPGASRESSRSKADIRNENAPQIQTERNARHGKATFEKRLKHGDLSGALQVVLDLNKKAQKTVFRKKSPEQIKTSRPVSTKRGKEENKYGSKGDLDKERDSSPYVKPMSVKKGDSKAGVFLLACEAKKEETPRQIKKPRKKIAFSASRSKSVPKINELPILEKIYL